MKTKRPAGFLNVDLEIESSSPLDSLAIELGKKVLVLHSGPGVEKRHLLTLECSLSLDTPDATVCALSSAIDRLSVKGREVWDNANRKVFDVGYELPADARNVQIVLQPETLARIVALGATVAFTCYRDDHKSLPN